MDENERTQALKKKVCHDISTFWLLLQKLKETSK